MKRHTVAAGRRRLVRFDTPKGEYLATHSTPTTRAVVDGEAWRYQEVGSKIRAGVVTPRR